MSHSTSTPRHPLLACLDAIEKALASAVDSDPLYLDAGEKAEFLLGLTRLISQQEALRLRAVAAAGDVAADHGCRTVADWVAPRTQVDRRAAYAQEKLAHALDTDLAARRRRVGRRAAASRPGPGHRQGPRRAPRPGHRRGQAARRAAAGRAGRAVRAHRPGPPRPAGPGRGRARGRRRPGTPRAGTGRGEGRGGDPAGLQAPRRRVHRHRRHRARRDRGPVEDLPRGLHLTAAASARSWRMVSIRPPVYASPPTGNAATRSAPSSNASTPTSCPTTAAWPPPWSSRCRWRRCRPVSAPPSSAPANPSPPATPAAWPAPPA